MGNKNTLEGKIEVLQISQKILKEHFRKADKVDWVLYKDMGIPDFLYEMLLLATVRFSTQKEVDRIAIKLGVDALRVRHLLKTFSLTELESAYMRKGKIIVMKVLKCQRVD